MLSIHVSLPRPHFPSILHSLFYIASLIFPSRRPSLSLLCLSLYLVLSLYISLPLFLYLSPSLSHFLVIPILRASSTLLPLPLLIPPFLVSIYLSSPSRSLPHANTVINTPPIYFPLAFSPSPHLHTSTPPHLHTSTPPHLHTSTPPHLHTSTPPHLPTSPRPLLSPFHFLLSSIHFLKIFTCYFNFPQHCFSPVSTSTSLPTQSLLCLTGKVLFFWILCTKILYEKLLYIQSR